MKFRITDVEFDFTTDFEEEVPESLKEYIRSKVIGKTYYAESPDFLADEVSEDTGWCILNLSYTSLDLDDEM